MDKKPLYTSYNWETINQYLQGNLTAQERHSLEKQALQDPFLADALEGLANNTVVTNKADIAKLNEHIINKSSEAKKVLLPIKPATQNWIYVAAVAAVFALAVVSIFLFNSKENTSHLVSNIQPLPPKAEGSKDTLNPTENRIVLAKKERIAPQNNTASTNHTNATITLPSTQNFNTSIAKTEESNQNVISESSRQNTTVIHPSNDLVLNGYSNSKQSTKADSIAFNFSTEVARSKEVESTKAATVNFNGLMNNSNLIQGKAITPQGTPIAHAYVQVPNTNYKTVTDKAGNFSVPTQSIQDSSVLINISSVGFNSTQAIANNNNSNLVVLTPADNALNEVVVTSLGNKNKLAKSTTAFKDIGMDTVLSPVGGWPAFENYLNNLGYKNSLFDSTFGNSVNTKQGSLPHQEVVIEFNADRRGNPTNIQVLQTPSQEKADKAVEAIKNGPKWSSKSKRAKAKLAIKL
jgi:hypothetical protein